jgi:foldase protein PrsA
VIRFAEFDFMTCGARLSKRAALLSVGLLVAGCEFGSEPASSVRDELAARPKSEAPATNEQPAKPTGPAVAVVNDRPISRREWLDLLIEARGLPELQQLILLEVARQEAQRSGLKVSSSDVDKEYDLTLQASRFNGKDHGALTPARREQLIAEWTTSRGISREELHTAIQRQAYLRKLAERHVSYTPEALNGEYDRVHGERVEAQHIQLGAPRFYDQIKDRLDNGEDFEKLAADFSQNILTREKRAMLPPFSKDDESVPPIFREVAFALEPGQVSKLLEAEGSFHVLKLVRRIPADGSKFEDVIEELRKNLHARLVAQEMERLGSELVMKARIKIEDPVMREQYNNRLADKQIVGPPLAGP